MKNVELSAQQQKQDGVRHLKASVRRNLRYQSDYHRCVELFAEPIKEVVSSVVYVDNTKTFETNRPFMNQVFSRR